MYHVGWSYLLLIQQSKVPGIILDTTYSQVFLHVLNKYRIQMPGCKQSAVLVASVQMWRPESCPSDMPNLEEFSLHYYN